MEQESKQYEPNMIVIKANNTDTYTKISNYSMEYIIKNIGFEALGIFHKLLSLPSNWHFNKEYFIKNYCVKKSRFDIAFKGLKDHGFIEQKPLKDKQGHFKGHTIILHEEPSKVKSVRMEKAFKKLDQRFGVVEQYEYAMPDDKQDNKQDKYKNFRVVN